MAWPPPQNIGKAVYKDKEQIISALRKAYPPFKETKEFEFAFKIRWVGAQSAVWCGLGCAPGHRLVSLVAGVPALPRPPACQPLAPPPPPSPAASAPTPRPGTSPRT